MRPLQQLASPRFWTWFELILATPVIVWGGWPFFVRGWQSIVNRSLNMFTLIGLGVGVAYLYSLIATLFPGIFPASFRDEAGAGRGVFRSGGRDRHTRVVGPSARTACAQPDRRRDQGVCWDSHLRPLA